MITTRAVASALVVVAAVVTFQSVLRGVGPSARWRRYEEALSLLSSKAALARLLTGRWRKLAPPEELPAYGPAFDELIDEVRRCKRRRRSMPPRNGAYVDAEAAEREIETMCEFKSAQVGDGGIPGDTWLALRRIMRLGDGAVPYLAQLAHSPNAVARYAAASALGEIHTEEADRLLDALWNDDAVVFTRYGCFGGPERVGDEARASWLKRFPVRP